MPGPRPSPSRRVNSPKHLAHRLRNLRAKSPIHLRSICSPIYLRSKPANRTFPIASDLKRSPAQAVYRGLSTRSRLQESARQQWLAYHSHPEVAEWEKAMELAINTREEELIARARQHEEVQEGRRRKRLAHYTLTTPDLPNMAGAGGAAPEVVGPLPRPQGLAESASHGGHGRRARLRPQGEGGGERRPLRSLLLRRRAPGGQASRAIRTEPPSVSAPARLPRGPSPLCHKHP